MKVKVRKSVCSSCPWKIENAHQLTKSTIKKMIDIEIISACHQEQAKTEGATKTTGVELYVADMKAQDKAFCVCRGFQEARTLAKLNHYNPMLKALDLEQEELGFTEGLVRLDYVFGEE